MRPKDYLKEDYHKGRHWELRERSDKIVEVFKKYVSPKDSILELGCSSGRNLVALQNAGFKNVEGLEMSDDINPPNYVKIIKGRWEETELKEYDVIFSASFLQEFDSFPQKMFEKTLLKCRKYFMIFGDYMGNHTHPNFEIVETTPAEEPFSQPILILKNEQSSSTN